MTWINTEAYMSHRRKHIDPDSYLFHALERLEIPHEDEDLFLRFVERKATAIDTLWTEFLQEEAMERLVTAHPVTSTRLGRTPLSNRTVNALRAAGFEKVGDVVQLTPKEMFTVRGIGRKGFAEVTEFLTANGFEMAGEPSGGHDYEH